MHKLVIVDDEYLVRLGIRETIDWAANGIEVIGDASNGKQGYEMIKELNPDLVITDIKMPIMNGVDLVKTLHKEGFNGEIVVLSGYKDFEYAKETFENGIFSYVVKPIDNDELLEVVLRAVAKLEQKIKDRTLTSKVQTELPTLQSEFMKKLLSSNSFVGSDIPSELSNHDISLPTNGTMALISIEEMFKSKKSELNIYINLLKEALSKEKIAFVDFDFQDSIVMFLNSNDIEKISLICRDTFIPFEQKTLTALTVGLTLYSSLEYIQKTYESCLKLVQSKLLFHLNTVEMELDDQTSYRHRQSISQFYSIIAEKYSTQLTVRSVSDEMNISESYLMHLLKDNLGKTFNEILTGYRIGIAKRLLLSGKYRINEVSDKVGYIDVKYFSQVFKKIVGVTPSDYQGHDIGWKRVKNSILGQKC